MEIGRIQKAILERKKDEIEELVNRALESGVDPEEIMNEGLIAPMDVIGRQFSDGTIFVPEMMLSALIMKMGLSKVKPHLSGLDIKPQGTIMMGTVKGDLHDIGKNIVIMMMEASGFSVVDLGVDVKAEIFVQKIKEDKPNVLGLSSLLTTTMGEIKNVIKLMEDAEIRNKVKVIVGCGPIDERFAKDVGSDGYGKDATEAVRVCRELMAKG
jgi:5-methyltetrahydrofolate--homocysteine methyltransferase